MHTKLAHSLLAMGCSACLSVSAIADDHIEPLFEHTPNSTTDKLDSFLGVFGAESEYEKEKGLNSSYIPAVFYTPEQGLGLGLLYVGLYGDPR